MTKILFALVASTYLLGTSANAAELLIDPDEFFHQHMLFRTNRSPTLVMGDNVNVRTLPGFGGNANTVFARLDRGDQVYVVGCEGFSEGHLWVHVYVPEITESGYVAAEYLQNNFNHIC